MTSARYRFGDSVTAERPHLYFSKKRPERVSFALSPLSCAFPEMREGAASLPATAHPSGIEASKVVDAPGETARESLHIAPVHAPRVLCPEDLVSEARIRELITTRTVQIRRELERRGERFAGPKRVMKMRPTTRSTHPVRTLNPSFATKDRALFEQAIAERKQFEIEHETAKRRYIAGKHKTLFPHGTYGYRVMLGVRVAKRKRVAA